MNIILLNSPYYKKNYLEDSRVVIILGEVNIPDIPVYLQLDNTPAKLVVIPTAELKVLDLYIISVATYI